MEFARKVWKLLVAVKDGLVLVFMLLFFGGLYALLSMRPAPGKIADGALLIELAGVVVEEPAPVDPFSLLTATQAPTREFRARDVARTIRAAAKDTRIKAVVLDMSRFLGGGYVNLRQIGAAMDEVRQAGKPVLTYANGYVDDGVQLAAHASEVWLDPMGAAFIAGPGGNNMYFGKALEKYGVTPHVYRVGTYKSAVEPYLLEGPSEPARRSLEAVYEGRLAAYRSDITGARPRLAFETVTQQPAAWIEQASGDLATAAKSAGLVDRLGSKTAFGERIAKIVGKPIGDSETGSFAATDYDTFLAATPLPTEGAAIGVVTIAGTIVDGEAGPGTAGGERIAKILEDALDEDLKALVVRIDSPGGSVMASERIRLAIEAFKEKKIPVVVSMGDMAASGGYWVATPAQRIFADPGTLTGSIGVFAVLASFEDLLADVGVTGGGVKTTPLSGQPDILFGISPEMASIFQSSVENNYAKFIGHVAQSRGRSPEQIDAIAQGRVWIGSDAKRIGLIDQYGDLQTALAYAAKAGGIGNAPWHAQYLGEESDALSQFLLQLRNSETAQASGDFTALVADRQRLSAAGLLDRLRTMAQPRGVQAYCMECPAQPGTHAGPAKTGLFETLALLAGFRIR
ncbi:signal peptide peptidase SppA [Novosphingobium aquimarinum]|uniref:signal peptide peptidase SppA n=1 Tax=Novosphingobium aquimarinum TaxID=2682494 RepID=UPI0012EB9338|nr:signal peptide peptidase SppA [Novosphingobium aquimarinum]